MPDIVQRIPTREEIEQRAYEIYLERGCQDGGDVDDWLIAEQELRQSTETQAPARLRAKIMTAGA